MSVSNLSLTETGNRHDFDWSTGDIASPTVVSYSIKCSIDPRIMQIVRDPSSLNPRTWNVPYELPDLPIRTSDGGTPAQNAAFNHLATLIPALLTVIEGPSPA